MIKQPKNPIIPGLVSTIIPVYNRAAMLREAVESVIRQDYAPIEIVIVDDGSSDDTAAFALELSERHDCVKLIRIENSGPGMAREAGRNIASGEFIQYLDSDDLLLPSKFSKQVTVLQENLNYGVCYCRTNIFNSSNNQTIEGWKRTSEKIPHIIPSMLASRWWGTSTPLYRRSVIDEAGPWKDLINEEDWEYDCRIGFTNGALGYVAEALSLQRQHDESRLSQHGATDPKKLAAKVKARQAIISYALEADGASQSEEFQTLLNYSFLLSRQCAAAGLPEESKFLFKLVKQHLKNPSTKRLQLQVYHIGSCLIGWSAMGRLSTWLDELRR